MQCHASVVQLMALCLSVCLSVTSRCSIKTAKHIITQTMPRGMASSATHVEITRVIGKMCNFRQIIRHISMKSE